MQWCKGASDSTEEKDLQVEKYQKDARALKAIKDEVASQRHALDDTLPQTM